MKRALASVFWSAMVIVTTAAVASEKPVTPEALKGTTVVDDTYVKANHGKVKIYDVRKKAEYAESHIAGAILVSYEEKSNLAVNFDASKDSFDLSKFPTDKNEPVIVYCNGPRCWKSYKAAAALVKAGYTKVHWYRNDGFPGWKAKGFPVE